MTAAAGSVVGGWQCSQVGPYSSLAPVRVHSAAVDTRCAPATQSIICSPPPIHICPVVAVHHHPHTQELARLGIDVVSVPRGGETTYHGPGQLVAYPILNLRQLGLGARAFVEGLEDAMVQTVGCFGIQVLCVMHWGVCVCEQASSYEEGEVCSVASLSAFVCRCIAATCCCCT